MRLREKRLAVNYGLRPATGIAAAAAAGAAAAGHTLRLPGSAVTCVSPTRQQALQQTESAALSRL